jgi:HPt (histidine-containing phosphotransfer) domain-containing protein
MGRLPAGDAPRAEHADGEACAPAAIDWAALWARLRRPDAVQQILQTLVEHHTGSAARLRELLARAEAREIAELAHQLGGVGGTVFAPRVREAAVAVEHQVHGAGQAEPAAVDRLADAVDALLATARAGLSDLECTRG